MHNTEKFIIVKLQLRVFLGDEILNTKMRKILNRGS